jgi:hypothetical protein
MPVVDLARCVDADAQGMEPFAHPYRATTVRWLGDRSLDRMCGSSSICNNPTMPDVAVDWSRIDRNLDRQEEVSNGTHESF